MPPRPPAPSARQRFAFTTLALAILVTGAGCSKPRRPELETFQTSYLMPRSHPDDELDQVHRAEGIAHVQAMHDAGTPHLTPGVLPVSPGACIWRQVGPTNVPGRVTSIAIDPRQGNRVWLATVGGIWRSADRGRKWARVSDAMRPGVFGAVAVAPDGMVIAGGGDPNYQSAARAGGPGIWISRNGGDTWTQEPIAELEDAVVFRVRVDPDAPHHLYVATSTGVWFGDRTSAVVQWSRLGGMDAPVSDLVVDFSASDPIVYAGVYEKKGDFTRRVWKWHGSEWRRASNGMANGSGIIALAMAPSRPATLYAKLEKQTDGSVLGVYRTTDGGNEWDRLTTPSQPPASDDGETDEDEEQTDEDAPYAWYYSAIEVDPQDPDRVYIGGVYLHCSTDGGANWKSIQNSRHGDFQSSYIHVDVHALAFDPFDPGILYVGTDGGPYRSSARPLPNPGNAGAWRWITLGHGLLTTELYRLSIRPGLAATYASGSQDNGTQLTFGNRSWYVHGPGDGGAVALDAKNYIALYETLDGVLVRVKNPVPNTDEYGHLMDWAATGLKHPRPPIVTDPVRGGRAIAIDHKEGRRPEIRITENGIDWSRWSGVSQSLPNHSVVTAMAVGPTSDFKSLYVGFRRTNDQPANVWSTHDGSGEWIKPSSLENLSPNAIAVDANDPKRAVVALGGGGGGEGGVFGTRDGGQTWTDLSHSGAQGLPNVPMTGVVIDPADDRVLYVCSDVGVFKGTLNADRGDATWVPFDEGLPEGLDVNDIAVNPVTSTLMIATMGYGVFERSIGPDPCRRDAVVIRDNVFDRGAGAAVHTGPNPERPVDHDGDGIYEPSRDASGQVYWWSSTDIRTSVPARGMPANSIDAPDHVEMETCAISAVSCPDGTIQDVTPMPGEDARVHVQVLNQGIRPLTQVKVAVLWSNRLVSAPPLPAGWGTSFGSGPGCGALSGTEWKYLDDATPCRSIDRVEPGVPEVVTFPWQVPTNAPGPYHFLALVESAEDPMPAAARGLREMHDLAPQHRHVALRSFQTLPREELSTAPIQFDVDVPDPSTTVVLAAPSAGPTSILAVLTPRDAGIVFDNAVEDSTLAPWIPAGHVIPSNFLIHRVTGEAGLRNFTSRTRVLMVFVPDSASVDQSHRVQALVRQGTTVVGGTAWVIRAAKK